MIANARRILKAAREKQQVTYKGNPKHLTADLSVETLQARRDWQDIFNIWKVLEMKAVEPKICIFENPMKHKLQRIFLLQRL